MKSKKIRPGRVRVVARIDTKRYWMITLELGFNPYLTAIVGTRAEGMCDHELSLLARFHDQLKRQIRKSKRDSQFLSSALLKKELNARARAEKLCLKFEKLLYPSRFAL